MAIELKPPEVIDIFLDLLERVDPLNTSQQAFQQRMEDALQDQGESRLSQPRFYYARPDQLLLGGEDLSQAIAALERIEQAPLRAIADALQEVIERREEQDDLWPEGRLQRGIALEALGDYRQARDVFEEVIQICESGGRFNDRAMAMAF